MRELVDIFANSQVFSVRRLLDSTILAATLAVAAAAPIKAQTSSGSDADRVYHDAITRALQEFDLGHWTEAKVFFREAHARKPSARTLRGIGLACYESRNYVEAIDYLEQALASSVQPLTPEMRTSATRLIEQSRQFVMRAQIEVQPANAEVRVDGKLAKLGAGGALLLDPGEHELSVSAAGYAPLRRRVNSEGGSAQQLHLALKPRAEAPGAAQLTAAPDEALEPESQTPSRSIAPWFVIGGSGAVAIAGGVLLGIGLSEKAAVEDVKDGARWSAQKAAADRAVPLQAAGGVMLGLGLAGVAAGVIWQLSNGAEETLAVSVSPTGVNVLQRF